LDDFVLDNVSNAVRLCIVCGRIPDTEIVLDVVL
jgi:hypothetical protein